MKILCVPSLRPRNGIGHFKRCYDLHMELSGGLRFFIPEGEAMLFYECISDRFPLDAERIVGDPRSGTWDFILLDRRETPRDLFELLAKSAPVIALDEGGYCRRYCHYTIDMFPSCNPPPNMYAPGLLGLPKPADFNRSGGILLAFGGEDPYGMAEKTVDAFIRHEFAPPEDLTVLQGPANRGVSLPNRVNVHGSVENLSGFAAGFRLVVSSFGLTPYETNAAGIPTVLVNPTRYHEKLSRLAGFYTLSLTPVRLKKLREDLAEARITGPRKITDGGETFADFFGSIGFSQVPGCPVCGNDPLPVRFRFTDKSYAYCGRCRLFVCYSFRRKQTDYSHDYFFEEYKKQYGRTYLDDFENIRLVSSGRVRILKKLLASRTGPLLLDIGCAYGPFMKRAAEEGFTVSGIDISAETAGWVRKNLGFDVAVGDFEKEFRQPDRLYDCVTMWFVIEHFRSLGTVLKRVYGILKPGGVFAFSTPNLSGISGRKNMKSFLEGSPHDHFTVWSPKSARKICRACGFRVLKIRVTGHHPERFPQSGSLRKKRFISRCLGAVSRLFRLGDTFEVYAVKAVKNG